MSATTRVLVALIAGILVGLVVLAYPSPALVLLVEILEPIGTLWVNAIRMTVIPLVVSLLISGVASSASMHAVRAIGLRALATFVGLLMVSAIVALAVVPTLFSWLRLEAATTASLRSSVAAPAATTAAEIPSFAEWVVSVVPANPVKAAADGAMLPVVVFALALGLALLTVAPDRREAVLAFIRGLADAMLAIVRVIIAIAPIGVFALTVPVISRTGLAAAGALGYYVLAIAIAQAIFMVLLYPIAAIAGAVPVARFARAVIPAQAVAVATTSSLASLPAMIDSADRRLGLPAEVTGVVLPLAVSTFKISAPILWAVVATFLARFYGVPLGPAQLAAAVLTGLLTSFSGPGIPHGWLLVIAPMTATLGIPAEGIGLLIAVDAVPDIFATTLNVTGDMVAAAIVARGYRATAISDSSSPGIDAVATV